MDTQQIDPGDLPRRPRWSGRTRRVVTTSAASAVLLAGGTAIGIAMTGGASAAVSPSSSLTPTASASASAGTTAPGTKASRCSAIVGQALNSDHDRLARLLLSICTAPTDRYTLVRRDPGEVTVDAKARPANMTIVLVTSMAVT